MTPGTYVRLHAEFARIYRKHGTSREGRVVSLSPSGAVSRVNFDDVADSYVMTDHLEAVEESTA